MLGRPRNLFTGGVIAAFALGGAGVVTAVATGALSSGGPPIPLAGVNYTGSLPAAGPTAATLSAEAQAWPALAKTAPESTAAQTSALDRLVADPELAPQGLSKSAARLAATSPTGASIYLVPGRQTACLLGSDGSVTACSPFPMQAANETIGGVTLCQAGSSIPHGDLQVTLLLPGQPSDVTARYSDGTTKAEDVTNGVFVADAPLSGPYPVSVSWAASNGSFQSASTGVPSDAASTNCAS